MYVRVVIVVAVAGAAAVTVNGDGNYTWHEGRHAPRGLVPNTMTNRCGTRLYVAMRAVRVAGVCADSPRHTCSAA